MFTTANLSVKMIGLIGHSVLFYCISISNSTETYFLMK